MTPIKADNPETKEEPPLVSILVLLDDSHQGLRVFFEDQGIEVSILVLLDDSHQV